MFSFMCVFHLCLSCVSFMCVFHVSFYLCLSCVSFICEIHVWDSCVFSNCVFHLWDSCVFFICVFHVFFHVWDPCVSFMWESIWYIHICHVTFIYVTWHSYMSRDIHICHVTYTKSERVIRLSCVRWERYCMLTNNLWYQVFGFADVKSFGYKLVLTKITCFVVEMCETDTV